MNYDSTPIDVEISKWVQAPHSLTKGILQSMISLVTACLSKCKNQTEKKLPLLYLSPFFLSEMSIIINTKEISSNWKSLAVWISSLVDFYNNSPNFRLDNSTSQCIEKGKSWKFRKVHYETAQVNKFLRMIMLNSS